MGGRSLCERRRGGGLRDLGISPGLELLDVRVTLMTGWVDVPHRLSVQLR